MIYELPKDVYGEIIFSEAGVEYYGIHKIVIAINHKIVKDRTRVYIQEYQAGVPKISFLRKYIDLAYYKQQDLYDIEGAPFKFVVDTDVYKATHEERIKPSKIK